MLAKSGRRKSARRKAARRIKLRQRNARAAGDLIRTVRRKQKARLKHVRVKRTA
jgi:hypothetical protein